jgi:geranylgeranyl diphosphate synthase type II
MPGGIVAGQAWECESRVSVSQYHREKTGSLFAAATVAGAQSAGGDAEAWRGLGEWLGEAYQAADDIRDVVADAQQLGKPIGRDAALGRPSVARERGLPAAMRHFDQLVRNAVEAVPECRGAPMLRALVRSESERRVPTHLAAPLRAAA